MRTFIAIIVGLLGGFVLGIALSSFIGILGMTLFNTPIGIKFLPYYTAIICAILVPFLDHKQKSG
ncbi:hypothetical protein GI584_06730 [Gracilibacillus salitolerans]|uniref:Uncharacterized protein n=1 Tax=Gracilibacillus salitolerans TaxID=2663022 RepID=A0A5Q2TIF0_9BACI|nr:DUF5957 family protein [Gracilibacillus salitolerans]QGH33730.1 hypothetical protein GI584_06730 [Gracilibacillus salitolerans]